MTVIVVSNVSKSLEGILSRWMLEPAQGVFVGRLSADLRALVWRIVKREIEEGWSALIYRDANEQGYSIEMYGDSRRELLDVEGMTLVRFNLPEDRREE